MEKVIEYVKKHEMLKTGDKIIVGVSGGADSVCLLFLLKNLRPKWQLSLEVVHIEHGIRGKESLEDADFVEKLCREWEVPFYLFRRDIPLLSKEWRCSQEEAGRRARYEAFEEVRVKTGADKIAVAHNQDDQAETILFHLARGSALRGLCGIFPVRDHIIRPLLCLKRTEIEEILINAGLSWRTDATNQEEIYTRNKIRLQILPLIKEELNNKADIHIARVGEKLLEAELFLREEARKRSEMLIGNKEGRLWLSREELLKEPAVMQDYILAECLGRVQDLDSTHFERLKRLLKSQSGRRMNIGEVQVRVEGEFLVFTKEIPAKPVADPQELIIPGEIRYGKYLLRSEILPYKNEIIPENRYTKWFDYDTITGTVQLRTRKPGDDLVVTSEGAVKTLKKYFIDEKIPLSEREQTVLLADGQHIIWVIGHRISEAYKVREKTKRVLKVQVIDTDLVL